MLLATSSSARAGCAGVRAADRDALPPRVVDGVGVALLLVPAVAAAASAMGESGVDERSARSGESAARDTAVSTGATPLVVASLASPSTRRRFASKN